MIGESTLKPTGAVGQKEKSLTASAQARSTFQRSPLIHRTFSALGGDTPTKVEK